MSVLEQHTRALAFIDRWKGHGDEKQETQRFWLDLLQNVLGVTNALENTMFEYKTAGGGFIDVLCPEARFLVEQKSSKIDLDELEERQGTKIAPIQQALRYANDLPFSMKPAVLCTCNFNKFRFYDLDKDPRATGKPADEFTLEELSDHLGTLNSVFSTEHSRLHVQQKLSEHAGLLVANLHNALAAQYDNPDDPDAHHSLATLTVRIVFCLYAEDAGLFPPNSFSDYVKDSDASHLRRAIIDLFQVLNTPKSKRDKYLENELRRFDYVNGGLFAEPIEIPQFTDDIRDAMVHAGDGFDWKGISPVIFGSLMEETLSHDQRRKGGMHYTTVENIHRLIDPLFLADLKAELKAIEDDKSLGERARMNRLKAYQNKLASLKFLDPACGSGNFLTETFLRLRELENKAIGDMLHGQGYMEFGGEDSLVKVSIDQFHGIEVNDFAVSVAKTALWIAEQQALDDTEGIAGLTLDHLPLHDSGNIVQANSLRYDWNELLSGDECSYVIGNPPFIGHQQRTQQVKEDMELVCGKDGGSLDYVAGWYFKALDYLDANRKAKFAFVSTNSITQGQQVTPLFGHVAEKGWRICFAHRTFRWNAQTTDNANVHVVIVGFDRGHDPATLFSYPDIKEIPVASHPKHINGYLLNAPDVFVVRRSQKTGPLSPMLALANFGSMPIDGGNLLLDDREAYDEAMADPIAAKYVRPYRMGKELINGMSRWCLWLVNAEPGELRKSKFIAKRVEACREYREHAPIKGDVYKNRSTPWLFRDNHQPDEPYLAIPQVFSGRREYATCDWVQPDCIAGSTVFICNDPDGINFAIIESAMFLAWQKAVGGRLKSDCRFSNTVVWNTLPLPQLDDDIRQQVICAGKQILAVREDHPDQSLADLYDPIFMPTALRKAHENLDKVVDVAFGAKKPCKTDGERLQILFNRYAEMTK